MAKHKEQANVEVATEEVEIPKVKVGDEEPTTSVDVKEKSTKPRAAAITKDNSTFRVLEGVEAGKYAGQRGHVIRAIQSLQSENPDGYFTIAQIAAKTDGLVTKTPMEASVAYHLKALAVLNMVEVVTPAKEPKAEKVKKEEAVAA